MANPRLSPLPQVFTAGEKLKRRRRELRLTMRDAYIASLKIAADEHNEEFVIAISRLSDIETKCAVPNIYRVHSLAHIYKIEVREILAWYGVGQIER